MGLLTKKQEISRSARAIHALRELKDTLHLLTPAEKSEVKAAMPFASSEWLDGLALGCRSDPYNEGSVHLDLTPAVVMDRSQNGRLDVMRQNLTTDQSKLALVLVGLPARGKSLLGHKLERFLSWRGYDTKAFRVGKKRREMSESETDITDSLARPETGSASFFDSTKAYAAMVREKVSLDAFDEAIEWLDRGGQVAIFDASNVSIQRRAKLQERCNREEGNGKAAVGIVFIESIVVCHKSGAQTRGRATHSKGRSS